MCYRYFEEFNKKVPLTSEEQEYIKTFRTLKRYRKRQYFLQEGDDVNEGVLKKKCHAIVQVNDEGSEPIVRFALEGNFMTDLYSFLTNEPSVYNIDATEDSGKVLIPKIS